MVGILDKEASHGCPTSKFLTQKEIKTFDPGWNRWRMNFLFKNLDVGHPIDASLSIIPTIYKSFLDLTLDKKCSSVPFPPAVLYHFFQYFAMFSISLGIFLGTL